MFPGQKTYQKCFNSPGLGPRIRWGAYSTPQTTSWISGEGKWGSEWKEGRKGQGKEGIDEGKGLKERKGMLKRKRKGRKRTLLTTVPPQHLNPGSATA